MFQLSLAEWQLVANCDQLPNRIKHSSIIPLAFTQEGVAMLSGVLRSAAAIQVNIGIMRAFVAVRHFVLNPAPDGIKELQNEVRELKQYMEDAFTDYNDINEDTRMQLELIQEMLAELQVRNRELNRNRRLIGFKHDGQTEEKA